MKDLVRFGDLPKMHVDGNVGRVADTSPIYIGTDVARGGYVPLAAENLRVDVYRLQEISEVSGWAIALSTYGGAQPVRKDQFILDNFLMPLDVIRQTKLPDIEETQYLQLEQESEFAWMDLQQPVRPVVSVGWNRNIMSEVVSKYRRAFGSSTESAYLTMYSVALNQAVRAAVSSKMVSFSSYSKAVVDSDDRQNGYDFRIEDRNRRERKLVQSEVRNIMRQGDIITPSK
jgi:hypothetical protein